MKKNDISLLPVYYLQGDKIMNKGQTWAFTLVRYMEKNERIKYNHFQKKKLVIGSALS